MVADLKKEIKENSETSDYGDSGSFSINGAEVEFQWDDVNENYIVDIYFNNWKGSYEAVLDQDGLSELEAQGLSYFNDSIRDRTRTDSSGKVRPYWPFGSIDHLHWPSQSGK